MVNGFVNFGALADKQIDKITPVIVSLVKKAKKNNFEVVAFKDCHSIDDAEFQTFPPHCLKGTPESELIPQLKNISSLFDFQICKNTTNGFVTKQFQNLLAKNVFDKVYVCGCCTDICVLNFVESYVDYINRNALATKIVVFENGCYTFDGENHNAQKCHEQALEKMENLGAIVLSYKNKENEKIL